MTTSHSSLPRPQLREYRYSQQDLAAPLHNWHLFYMLRLDCLVPEMMDQRVLRSVLDRDAGGAGAAMILLQCLQSNLSSKTMIAHTSNQNSK